MNNLKQCWPNASVCVSHWMRVNYVSSMIISGVFRFETIAQNSMKYSRKTNLNMFVPDLLYNQLTASKRIFVLKDCLQQTPSSVAFSSIVWYNFDGYQCSLIILFVIASLQYNKINASLLNVLYSGPNHAYIFGSSAHISAAFHEESVSQTRADARCVNIYLTVCSDYINYIIYNINSIFVCAYYIISDLI